MSTSEIEDFSADNISEIDDDIDDSIDDEEVDEGEDEDEEEDVDEDEDKEESGDKDEEDEEEEEEEEEEKDDKSEQKDTTSSTKQNKSFVSKDEILTNPVFGQPDDDDDDDYLDESIHQKLKTENYKDDLILNHPECKSNNYDEIYSMVNVTRDSNNIIVDELHKTNPILTKYEKTRILGQRIKQLNIGHPPFVRIDKPILDNHIIAEKELYEKKLPFIIQRPIPNGSFEYWHVRDLEVL